MAHDHAYMHCVIHLENSAGCGAFACFALGVFTYVYYIGFGEVNEVYGVIVRVDYDGGSVLDVARPYFRVNGVGDVFFLGWANGWQYDLSIAFPATKFE